MFSDADLLGVPVRIVVSPRTLQENMAELSTRDKRVSRKVHQEEIVAETCQLIENLRKEIEEKI